MPKLSLFASLYVVLMVLGGTACEFYTAGTPTDAGPADANRVVDAQDQDFDAMIVEDAVAPDAESQADAGIEQCGQVGGVCTSTLDVVCPPGTRPYGDDESFDCPGPGHCCVPDPPSTCNSTPTTNCSMTSECTGCWAPATDTALYCDGGRPCCEWTCGG